jgi:hypothetical protein
MATVAFLPIVPVPKAAPVSERLSVTEPVGGTAGSASKETYPVMSVPAIGVVLLADVDQYVVPFVMVKGRVVVLAWKLSSPEYAAVKV